MLCSSLWSGALSNQRLREHPELIGRSLRPEQVPGGTIGQTSFVSLSFA